MEKQLDQEFVNTEKEVVLKKLDAEHMRGDLLSQKHGNNNNAKHYPD